MLVVTLAAGAALLLEHHSVVMFYTHMHAQSEAKTIATAAARLSTKTKNCTQSLTHIKHGGKA